MKRKTEHLMSLKKIDYSKKDLIQAYCDLQVTTGDIILISSNLTSLGRFEERDKNKILEAHYLAIMEVIGPTGTLVVPTFSFYLANTDKIYNPEKSHCETSVFSEYIRNLPSAIRSFHPFNSFTAIGHHAEFICTNNTKHAYGLDSPADKMIQKKAKAISIGLEPKRTCSLFHHAEYVMGVPYRYIKEFILPTQLNDSIEKHAFYQNVWYRGCDITFDDNKKLYANFEREYQTHVTKVGRGHIYLYKLDEFFKSNVQSLKEDIYVCLEMPPTNRVYQK